MIADLSSQKIIAELRTEGQFSLEAPILRKQSPGKDDWYLAGQLFKDGKLDEDLLRRIIA
ncbi:hypothetical protein M0R72_14880 [Candidatus Pacearchaeota archaeon]|jgi:hypothetical protein|nr:hypothetical protein [Candidatus Pacearchaeota archaeon]